MKKNDRIELVIEDLSEQGLGVGRKDGFVWFVKDAVIGDYVQVQVMKLKKNYGFARIVRVIRPSEYRTTTACPEARRCGGCQIQQMKYEAQLNYKQKKVYNNLLRIGEVGEAVLNRVLEDIIGMERPLRYRNKAQYPVSRNAKGELTAGFYAGRTHEIIACEDCLLGDERNKDIIRAVLNWMEENAVDAYDERTGEGCVRHIMIRQGFSTGQSMVVLVINAGDIPQREALLEVLLPLGIDCVSLNINRERNNVIMGEKTISLYGPGYIEDCIGDIRFRISPMSFYQVNPVQTEHMYALALEYAGLTGKENVWDLYCGIGTISLFMAGKAGHVYGVEIIPDAIEDAKLNARLNGIENADFYVGAAEEVLPVWYENNPDRTIDVVCVDPPRKGCDEIVLKTIIQMNPERIVYVSCDSATLARDVKYLQENGYVLKKVRPVDNFPQTVHVETVCFLSKKNG